MLRLGGLAGGSQGSFSIKIRLQFRRLFTQFSITLALIPICNTPKIWYSGRLNKLSGCYGDWYPTQDNIERDKVNIIKTQPKRGFKVYIYPNIIQSQAQNNITVGPKLIIRVQKIQIHNRVPQPSLPIQACTSTLNYLRKRAKSQLSLVRSQV